MAWIETGGAVAACAFGAFAGLYISRMPGRRWLAFFFAGLVCLLLLAAVRRFAALSFVTPFSWFARGRLEFALSGVAIPLMFMSITGQVPKKRLRVLLVTIAALGALQFAVLPFALPGILRGYLLRLDTQVDSNGVCIQNTYYTCGPAAAVTALGLLGIDADEGEIAVLSRSTPISGTEPDMLSDALEKRYESRGLRCEYRAFRSAAELPAGAPVLATVRLSFLVDHYVTILDISGTTVTIGDPLNGRREVSLEEFERSWRGTGIIVTREGPE